MKADWGSWYPTLAAKTKARLGWGTQGQRKLCDALNDYGLEDDRGLGLVLAAARDE
jgi:hypothetical protein